MQSAVDAPHPYQCLTPDLVLDAMDAVGLPCEASVFPLNSYENRVYQLRASDGRALVVKFYRPGRWTQAQILEEHQFAVELAALDIPVVAPLALEHEQTLHQFAGFQFAVYPRLGGRAPELEDGASLRVIGRYIGRVHLCGGQQPFVHRNTLDPLQQAQQSRDFLLEAGFLPLSLESAYASLSDHLIERMAQRINSVENPAMLRLHGDCHLGNVLWNEGMAHFVDLDDAVNGPAVQDLWMLLSGEREQQQQQLELVLEGYRAFMHFDARELILIEPLRSLRIMHYSAWLARRWQDPAFPMHFPWFNSERYWAEHVLQLREQLAALDEAPLQLNPW